MTPAARREATTYLRQTFEMSERRACRVIGTDRTSVRYQATRPDDAALRERLKALAQERRRFGYRRLHVLLRREGHAVNRKRVQRLYREERLTLRRRGGRKRAMGTRRPIETPLAPNQRWSLDVVSDQLTDGRRFRILAWSNKPLFKVSFSFIQRPSLYADAPFGLPPMSERIEFIDIALQERRTLETALAELVAKHSRSPSPELARMIQIIEAEVIQRQRVPAILLRTEERIQKNDEATVGQAS